MTSSNEISRKSRTFTWSAITISIVTAAAFGFLLFKVNQLEAEYGSIRDNRTRIESFIRDTEDRNSKLEKSIAILLAQKSILASKVSEYEEKSKKLEGLKEAIADTNSQLEKLRSEEGDVKKLIADRDIINNEIQRQDGVLRNKADEINNLNLDVARLKDDKNRAENSARSAQGTSGILQIKIEGQKADKDALMQEISDFSDKKLQYQQITRKLNDTKNRASEEVARADNAERQANAAEDQLNITKEKLELAQKDLDSLSANRGKNREILAKLEEEVRTLKGRKDSLEKTNSELQGSRAELDRVLVDLKKAREDYEELNQSNSKVKSKVSNLQVELDGKQVELAKKSAILGVNEELIEKIKDDIEKEKGKLSSLVFEISAQDKIEAISSTEHQNTKEALLVEKANLKGLRTDLAKATAELSRLQVTNDALRDIEANLKVKEPILMALKQDISSKKAELDLVQNELTTVLNANETEQVKMNSIETDINRLKNSKTDIGNEINSLDARWTTIKASYATEIQKSNKLDAQILDKKRKLRSALIELDDLNDEIRRLKETIQLVPEQDNNLPQPANDIPTPAIKGEEK